MIYSFKVGEAVKLDLEAMTSADSKDKRYLNGGTSYPPLKLHVVYEIAEIGFNRNVSAIRLNDENTFWHDARLFKSVNLSLDQITSLEDQINDINL